VWKVKLGPSLAAIAVVLGACTTSAFPVQPPTTTSSLVTTTVTVVTTTSSSTAPTTTTLPHSEAVALIAPSGVPVAVTGYQAGTFHILTPCGYEATLTEGTPIHHVDVVIDPGHGGPIDTGAVAPTGLKEKDLNLTVSFEIQRILTERGIASMLTRVGDYPVPIPTRARYADIAGATALVSIHHNAPAAPASNIPGIEIFVQQDSSESMRLGGLLFEETMDALGQFQVDWDRSPDAGVMTVVNPEGRDAYGMIRRPETTSALIELGYIANRAEAELYATPEYVPAAATAVADAIETFLTTNAPGSGFVEGRVFRPNRGVGQDVCIEADLELALYPDMVDAEVLKVEEGIFDFFATVSSPYDTPLRFADAWRVMGDDGVVYGVNELLHDHATEQPFTRPLAGVAIPDTVDAVTIQGRDSIYGWGGGTFVLDLP